MPPYHERVRGRETGILLAWIGLCLFLLFTPWGRSIRELLSRWIAS